MGGIHVHQDAQPGQPLGQAKVALVVLDRQNESPDRPACQGQRAANRGEDERPADVRQHAAGCAHAKPNDVLVEQRFNRPLRGRRVPRCHSRQKRRVALHA